MILAVQILEQDVVRHPLAELLILEAAVLDERADIVPVFVIIVLVGFAHAGELVRNLLRDVVRDLLRKAVVLQCGSRYVQRQVRAVQHALEQHEIFRNDLLDIVGDEDLIVVQLDHAFRRLVFQVDLREIQDALEVERIIHVQVDPEQGLLVIVEEPAVELLVFLLRAVFRRLLPQRMDIVSQLRSLPDLQLLLRLLPVLLCLLLLVVRRPDLLDYDVIRTTLGLPDRLGFLRVLHGEVNLNRHETAVLLNDFLCLVVVREFHTVVRQVQCDGRADRRTIRITHGIFGASVAFPVDCLRILLVGQGVDCHQIRNHERGVEAQAEVADDLIIVGLVLVFVQEGFRAGESNVIDILPDLVRRHAKAVIDDLNLSAVRIQNHVDPCLVIICKLGLTHHLKLLQLRNRVAAVRNQLTVKNIVVRIQPLLDDGEHVLTVNG